MTSFRRSESIKISLLLLFFHALITACGESSTTEDDLFDPAELVVIDSAYLENTPESAGDIKTPTTTTYPMVAYPIQVEDEIEIRVGELFGYESFNWESLFPWNFEVSQPEIVDGDGTICAITSDDVFSTLGISPGSCSLKYPSTNGTNKGFIFLTITVVAS